MEFLSNGSFYLSRGELAPFMCPNCRSPIPYRETTDLLTCPVCKFEGEIEDFSNVEWSLQRPN